MSLLNLSELFRITTLCIALAVLLGWLAHIGG